MVARSHIICMLFRVLSHLQTTFILAHVINYEQQYYSGTPLKGHTWNEDTSLIRTLDEVPTSYKYVLLAPWNEDTPLIRTHFRGPRVSVLERSHCITLPRMYCRGQQSRSSCSSHGWTNIFLLSFLLKDSKLCQLDEWSLVYPNSNVGRVECIQIALEWGCPSC